MRRIDTFTHEGTERLRPCERGPQRRGLPIALASGERHIALFAEGRDDRAKFGTCAAARRALRQLRQHITELGQRHNKVSCSDPDRRCGHVGVFAGVGRLSQYVTASRA